VGFSVRWFYRIYLPAGCPHWKDARSRVWVNGAEFRVWYHLTHQKQALAADEVYCAACKRRVRMGPTVTRSKNGLVFREGICPACGRKTARILGREPRRDQPGEL
jgi:hypothetical protein